MVAKVRIKRRANGGGAGAPASLENAELAFNEQTKILYYGEGTGGAGGTATTIIPIGGEGAFAPLNSPALTGTPTVPTAAVDTSTTQAASTAFVLGQAGSAAPVMDGAAAAGTSLRYSRQDHVHPSDTSKANLASPTFTGTPAAPTAAVDTSTTQLATTGFVTGQAASATPLISSGAGAVGTSLRYARGDHAHPMERLDQLLAPTAAVAFNGQRATGLADPTSAQDAATKNYVDNAVQGLDAKESVRVASTANQALSGGTAFPTIDGVVTAAGNRVLLKDQTTTNQNGIYVVGGIATAWTLTRAADADEWDELPSAFVFVEVGTANADTGWTCTVDQGGTLGTTAVTWVQFNGAAGINAGNGLTKTGNTIDVVGTANRITVAADSIDIAATYVGQTSITTLGTVTTGTWSATAVAADKGGTGQVTYTVGDILYASGAAALAKLAAVAVGNVLISGGVGAAPSWGKVALTTHVSGTLPVANGGTGAVTLTGYVKGNGTGAMTAAATIPNTDITGLGSMATQNATAVAITGGTIDGITLDGGTF